MKHPFILAGICFCFMLNNSLSAQKDFRPGYMINLKNDTIKGVINMKSNIQNSKICEFKQSSNDQGSTMYTPQEIKSYRIEDSKYYVSKEVLIDSVKENVFLEFLVDGIVDLFSLRQFNNEFYFLEKDGKMYPLTNEEITVLNEKGTAFLKNSEAYKRILIYLFQDSPVVINSINSLTFENNPLVKIVTDYHNDVCKDYQCINYSTRTKIHFFLEPNLNYNFSTFEMKGSPESAVDNKIGFGINIRIVPVRWKRLNIITGISYTTSDYSQVFTRRPNLGSYYNFLIETNYSIVKIPLIAEYSFLKSKIRPYISVGYNNILILNGMHKIINIGNYYDEDILKSEYKA